MFKNPELLREIKDKLEKTWSPEQIVNSPNELKMPNRNADTMAKTIIEALSHLPPGAVKKLPVTEERNLPIGK